MVTAMTRDRDPHGPASLLLVSHFLLRFRVLRCCFSGGGWWEVVKVAG